MDRLGKLPTLRPPFLPPKTTHSCPTHDEPGYQAVSATEAGIPTAPGYTPNLDAGERRRRLIVYMVRYNRLDSWMKDCIINTGLSQGERAVQIDWAEKTRKALQAQMVGNSIPEQGTGGWFISFLLFTISEDDSKTYLYNIRQLELTSQIIPASESPAGRALRLAAVNTAKERMQDHKNRWLAKIDDAIANEKSALEGLPAWQQSNLGRVQGLSANIARLTDKVFRDPIPICISSNVFQSL